MKTEGKEENKDGDKIGEYLRPKKMNVMMMYSPINDKMCF